MSELSQIEIKKSYHERGAFRHEAFFFIRLCVWGETHLLQQQQREITNNNQAIYHETRKTASRLADKRLRKKVLWAKKNTQSWYLYIFDLSNKSRQHMCNGTHLVRCDDNEWAFIVKSSAGTPKKK